ncbi:MAG: hypothetical protein ACOY3I_06190 [Verrucomicrobiota bacterium]
MNRKIAFSLALMAGVLLCQSFLQENIKEIFPLIQLMPILLVFWAWKLEAESVVWLVCAGGLMSDFLVPDALGWGPVVMGITILLARTQTFLLKSYGLFFFALVIFTATFLYLALSRLAFLVTYGYWSWDQRVNFTIFTAALFNALASPLCLWLLQRVYREPKQRNVFVRNVRS